MNRILGSLSMLALCAVASAQCFESNFGTLLGTGDDTAFPSTTTSNALGFTFPIGANNYTHYTVNTNGACFLWTGATGILGATGTGYSTTSATQITNLRGAAGGSPRLAPYWRDLNLTAGNSGGLFYNNSIPGRGVFTWRNAVHFGATSPIFTVQMQIFSTGQVWMFYSGTTQTNALTMCGLSAGGAVADPGASDLSVAASGATTAIVYQQFATNTFDLQNTTLQFTPNGLGGWDRVPTTCQPANNTVYGTGCNGAISATAYELFPTNTIDLSNSSLRMTPTGSGYLFTTGTGTNYTHTVAGLALTDDSVATLSLPTPFAYPGGTTSQITICSNGYIWMQSPNLLADFTPTAAELFSNPARLCPMWCDGVPDGTTNINNVFAEVDPSGTKAYVTWVGVPIFGGVGGTMNVQVELDLVSGAVEYRYGAISVGNTCLVGWTPGTGFSAVDAGSLDLSGRLPVGFTTSTPEVASSTVTLAATASPIIGTTMSFQTSGLPASGLSFYLLSAGQLNPGVNLGILGAPACFAYITLPEALSVVQIGTPTATASFGIPNDPFFAGQSFFSQVAAVDPTANALGFTTSNGVRSFMNAF